MNSNKYYLTKQSYLPKIVILPTNLKNDVISEINADCFYNVDEEEILIKIIELISRNDRSEQEVKNLFLDFMLKKSKEECENIFFKQYEQLFKEFTNTMFSLFMMLKENTCYVDGILAYQFLHIQGGVDLVLVRSDLDEELKCVLKY